MRLEAFTPSPAPCTLAQQSAGSAIMWMVVLLAFVIGGAVALYLVRRQLLNVGEEDGSVGAGLTLHDLRMLHQRGSLSDAEFESAKRTILGKLGENLSKSPPRTENIPRGRRSASGFDLTGERLPKEKPDSHSDRP